jgi:hypothetical protein
LRTKQLIFLAIFIPTISFGQTLSDSLLCTFYNKILTLYFPDTTIHKDQAKFGCILLQTDLDTSKLIKNSGTNKFKFFSSKTKTQSVLERPLRKNRERSIYRITQKIIGFDTIDIKIGGWTITHVDKHNLTLGAWCGGRMGDIPDARFIYNKTINSWTFISLQELFDEEVLRLRKQPDRHEK